MFELDLVKNIKIAVDEARMMPIDADLQVPDTTKFCNHTGWKTEISFDQTMKDLLNYVDEKDVNDLTQADLQGILKIN